MANPAGPFSVSKFHRDLESHGLAIAEETLHNLLNHLEDVFMVRLVSTHTASERQRMRNPRTVYPVDPGLIPVFQRAGRENRGHSLETAVLIELERRSYDVGWVRVGSGLEVDFFAEHHVAEPPRHPHGPCPSASSGFRRLDGFSAASRWLLGGA